MDRSRKFIQMDQFMCCTLLFSIKGTGAFSSDFTINMSLQCRAFTRALQTEKLKVPLFPVPVGIGISMTGA